MQPEMILLNYAIDSFQPEEETKTCACKKEEAMKLYISVAPRCRVTMKMKACLNKIHYLLPEEF